MLAFLTMKMKNKNCGFTLFEILLVIGFIALAGTGIYTIYSKVQNSSKAASEAKNISLLKAGVKNIYGGTVNYITLTNQVLNDARGTPESMGVVPYVAGATAITNVFGGSVVLEPITLGGTPNNGFRITYPEVPVEVCNKLILATEKDFDQLTIEGVLVKSYGTRIMDIPAMTGACASNDKVTILFDSL